MPAYPSTLPRPTRQGYGLEPRDCTQRTPMEFGVGRVRRRFTRAPTDILLRWQFTQAEFAQFEAWWTQITLDGSVAIDMPLANGDGVNSLSARFVGAYHATLRGTGYEVAAKVDTTSLPQLTAAQLAVASAYAPADLLYGSPALHILIHTTLPGYW